MRQDHRAAKRRLFSDDEDEFGLEALLQAACFARSGATDVPPPPWAPSGALHRATEAAQLSDEVRSLLEAFPRQAGTA